MTQGRVFVAVRQRFFRPSTQLRRPWPTIVAAVAASAAPMLVLVVPAILHLPAVEPLLHESVLFPGFSRAFLVAVPIAGLVLVNFATVVATWSLRSAVVAIAITTALALVLVLGAAAAVEALDHLGDGID